FSSRRRHTRWPRDWSSDVCSSDLMWHFEHSSSKAAIEDECSKCHMPMARYQSKFEGREGEVFSRLQFGSDNRLDQMAQDGVSCRSEERRVGKECRSGWAGEE